MAGRHQAPRGTLALKAGRVLADTTGTSGAFQPLALTVTRSQGKWSTRRGLVFGRRRRGDRRDRPGVGGRSGEQEPPAPS
jgi:hypothetical protein